MAETTPARRQPSTEFADLLSNLPQDTTDREAIAIEEPYSGEELGTVPAHTADDVRVATERAADAQES
jgi:succinate-semialdehyde dehydrogenase/glutarate-semialdehyde dehydrogenase